MNVITLKPHRYKNKQKKPGDAYDFKGRAERRLAIALGWVKRTHDDNVVYPTVTAVAESPIVVEEVTEALIETDLEESINADEGPTVIYKPKRTYKRRDLTAEEPAEE